MGFINHLITGGPHLVHFACEEQAPTIATAGFFAVKLGSPQHPSLKMFIRFFFATFGGLKKIISQVKNNPFWNDNLIFNQL